MAVTVISRPLGHKLDITALQADVLDSSGDALVYKAAHGIPDNTYIYVDSYVDSYNGFKLIDVVDVNSFYILNDDGTRSQFKQEIGIYFYLSDEDHAWQCVHLPIVYELESDLYPVNSVDPDVSAAAYGFVNGYFALTHTALSGADALFALDYVAVKDGAGGQVILQVVEVVSTTITVLNYDGVGVTIDTMQKVRNNYHIDVRVYAGLPSGHPWEAEKPYELAATLKFIPDSDNRIKFSISEILKGYINTRNNLTLDTLPNNIDFFTEFYIEYAEGYDVSDGTEVTAFLDTFTDDSGEFEGQAVNAMLPFKNLYSGFMSDYISSGTTPSRWLTTMDRPIIWANHYFDISFINTMSGADISISKNGALYLTLQNPGIGVLRIPITVEGETEICLQAYFFIQYELSSWVNEDTGGPAWTTGPTPSISLTSSQTSDDLVYTADIPAGEYTIGWDITSTGNGGEFTITYYNTGTPVGSISSEALSIGTNLSSGAITLTDSADEVKFKITASSGASSVHTINGLNINRFLTESLCMDVLEDCDSSLISDNLRLIESGAFRELE